MPDARSPAFAVGDRVRVRFDWYGVISKRMIGTYGTVTGVVAGPMSWLNSVTVRLDGEKARRELAPMVAERCLEVRNA